MDDQTREKQIQTIVDQLWQTQQFHTIDSLLKEHLDMYPKIRFNASLNILIIQLADLKKKLFSLLEILMAKNITIQDILLSEQCINLLKDIADTYTQIQNFLLYGQ